MDHITAWCRSHAEEELLLLKKLTAIPSPSHNELQRAEFIKTWLIENGAANVRIDSAYNVILEFNYSSLPYSVFMAHTDVVFPDKTPLPVSESNGCLYAPGVGDDTANVVALMLFAKYLIHNPACHTKPLLFVFNSCEEGLGNLKGIKHIVSSYSGRISEIISFDGTYLNIVNRAVGSERWRVTLTTVGGHSYADFGNPNAIACLASFITKLYSQVVPSLPDSKTTFNVGTIQGGTSVNTIAQNAELLYEYRSDHRECLLEMRDQFEHLLKELAGNDDFQIRTELLGERPCGGEVSLEEEEKLLSRCEKAVYQVTGHFPNRKSGSTDANIPLSLGIPAATFGLYIGGKAHSREEYLEIDSLKYGLEIGLRLILATCDNQ